ncbi:MAG: aldo/keto reductase [Thermoplasmatota archaeon]
MVNILEKRDLGNTGHNSSIVTFGSISLAYVSQKKADELIELALSHGVNHFDTAPSYGDAELKLKPMLKEHRDEIFLACKTNERSKEGAWKELNESLERMEVDHIDLYQFHAITEKKEIEQVISPGGALEAFKKAKEEGLIDHIGLSTHGKPDIIKEFMDKVELDTVLFPLNFSILAKDDPKYDVESILDLAEDKGMGTIGIKAFAKGPWPKEIKEKESSERPHPTWYEPFEKQRDIDKCLRFALSQGLTTITSAGSPALVPKIIEAAERYKEMSKGEQKRLLSEGKSLESPVPTTKI